MEHYEHHTIPTNGINLHVVQAGPDDGPLVILLHGFPEFWYGWKKQMDHLAGQGFRVWAPDQRGYNLSDKPKGIHQYRLETLTQDIIGLIDTSRQEKVFLAGHDWGAGVAWWTAITHPERLKKLAILNAPHPVEYARHLSGDLAQQGKSWYIVFFQIPVLPEAMMTLTSYQMGARTLQRSRLPGSFTDDDLKQYISAWSQPGALTGMVNWYRALFQLRPKFPADMRVHVPTLLIWGAHDVALRQVMAQPSIDLCDDGRLVLFEDATHWVQRDKAAEVSHLLTEFFGPAV